MNLISTESNEEFMRYWKDILSMSQRALSDKDELAAVSVIKKGQLEVRFSIHDNWNGGIDYWDIIIKLKYTDYYTLTDRSSLEKKILESVNSFHCDDSNIIANVIIEPLVERIIDWKSVIPDTKESTIKLVLEEKNVLTDHATGKALYKSEGAEEDYQKRHYKILSIASRAGFDYPINANSLAEWWEEVRCIPTYAERRSYISKKFSPLMQKLQESEDNTASLNFSLISEKSDTVMKAVEDAEVFIRNGRFDSAVDRIHTAFHGYLQHLLTKHHVSFDSEDSLPALYTKLHTFYGNSIQPHDVASRIKKIVRSGIGVVDAVNDLRNNNTLAHPNDPLIQKREAELVIRLINVLIEFIEDVEQKLIT